jgi:L-ascorbate metabolism protein UlaG (beta-lactamase superfamily)
MTRSLLIPAASLLLLALPHRQAIQPVAAKAVAPCDQEACKSWKPACTGGPVPTDPDILVIRWLGNANYEVSFRRQVILIDNFYNRGSRAPAIGFTAEEVKTADAIFVTHGHKDHMSDTAQVARQTRAPVYGHQTVIDKLLTQGVAAEQMHAFRGLETYRFDGFTVQMIHVYHNIGAKTLYRDAINQYMPPTPEQLAEEAAINAKGSNSPDITLQGLFAFLLAFDSGFTFLGAESAAHPLGWTEQLKSVVKENGNRFDVAAVPYQVGYAPAKDIQVKTWPFIRLTNPRLILPLHHDTFPDFPMSPTEPLAQKIREELPGASFYSPLYREPLCFNVHAGRNSRLMPLCPR